MNSGVYKLYWENNPAYYFGNSKNLRKRLTAHLSKLRLGKHYCTPLQQVYNQYGDPLLEMIAHCKNEYAQIIEKSLIDYYSNDSNCCNIYLNRRIALIKSGFARKNPPIPSQIIEGWKALMRQGDMVTLIRLSGFKYSRHHFYSVFKRSCGSIEIVQIMEKFFKSVAKKRLAEIEFFESLEKKSA